MDERTLALDVFLVFVHVGAQDIFDLVVVEQGSQASGRAIMSPVLAAC